MNSLRDPDRSTRKRGLAAIRDAVVKKVSRSGADGDSETMALKKYFADRLAELLIALFGDPVEKCREESLGIYAKGIELGCFDGEDAFAKTASSAVEAVRQRIATPTVIEPSEEIRLGLIELVHALVKRPQASKVVSAILGEIVPILAKGARR